MQLAVSRAIAGAVRGSVQCNQWQAGGVESKIGGGMQLLAMCGRIPGLIVAAACTAASPQGFFKAPQPLHTFFFKGAAKWWWVP